MALNYLPFQRRETVVVPAALAARVLTAGFSVTNLSRMSSGSTKRAIVQDIIVYPLDHQYQDAIGNQLRMRIGVDGRNYMTEDLYDYRMFHDISHPAKAIWDWSCGKKTQKMTVRMQRSHFWAAQLEDTPISIMFNGLKVPNGSPVGTKDGEPIMLYATVFPPVGTQADELIALVSPRLLCPKDSPVDLYSVTVPESLFGHADSQIVYILDGNERPFWSVERLADMVSINASPISFGYGGVMLDPDETIRVELENADVGVSTDTSVVVTYRGVLEVEDGR
jgi:hypothetical protein